MEEQHHDIRLRSWERKFSEDFAKLEKFIDAVPFVEKDAAYICLTELSDTVAVWEKKQLAYDSEHKTDVYHDFQDFKAKLLIQLDGIEVSSIPKIKVNRSTLYNRIEKLSKTFDRKIHAEHYTCPHCVQVKEIRINL